MNHDFWIGFLWGVAFANAPFFFYVRALREKNREQLRLAIQFTREIERRRALGDRVTMQPIHIGASHGDR